MQVTGWSPKFAPTCVFMAPNHTYLTSPTKFLFAATKHFWKANSQMHASFIHTKILYTYMRLHVLVYPFNNDIAILIMH